MSRSYHLIKASILAMIFLCISVPRGFSQIKVGDGVYILVNFVPMECAAGVNGFYRVSKDRKISIPLLKVDIDIADDITVSRRQLIVAVHDYCREVVPNRLCQPDVYFIPEKETTKAGTGVLILGQARAPGVIPLTEGLTLYQAIRAARGGTEFSALRHTALLRDRHAVDLDLTDSEVMQIMLRPGDVINVARKNIIAND